MKLLRRQFLCLTTAAAALPVVSRFAGAQSYPTRLVRIVLPFTAGASSDILARLMGQWLSERIGQPFVVENRPGAAGNMPPRPSCAHRRTATRSCWRLRRPRSMRRSMRNLNFNFIRDIAPVASIIRTTYVMAVNPTVPAKTVPEFILYANANSGKISMASVGIGSGTHIAGELFKMMTGINMLHVPYRGGGPALTDLLGGQMQVMFVTPVSSIEYIKTGRLRALAVTAATRSDALPDIPTVGEFVPGYEASVWFGVGAPKATPAEIVEKLNKEINAGLADPKTKARLADLGGTPLVGSPADFGKLIADETEKWGKVVKFLGIKAD